MKRGYVYNMYLLKEYYLNKEEICEHIITSSENIEDINKEKKYLAKMLEEECGVVTYEILATRNMKSLQKILMRDDIKVFQVVNI